MGCSAETDRVPIVIADFGTGDQPLRFGQWLLDDGETVLTGDRVAEVVTTGVLLYVTSPADGMLFRGNVMPGRELHVGEMIGGIVPVDADSPVG